MDSWGVAVIYFGIGAAFGWLRVGQGLQWNEALLAVLGWPLEITWAWLALLAEAAGLSD